jgi:hypothetical protein
MPVDGAAPTKTEPIEHDIREARYRQIEVQDLIALDPLGPTAEAAVVFRDNELDRVPEFPGDEKKNP